MSPMTTSELRAFQQICDPDGSILVIACDQRGGIRQLLASDPKLAAEISDQVLGDTKSDIVSQLARHAPSVLLDPICAVPRVIEDGTLPRDVALLIGLDASGFDRDGDGHYLSRLVPGVTARRVRALGGTGGKLMIYLRADHPEASEHNLAILRQCLRDFAEEDVLLVVEFLTYRLPSESEAAYKALQPELVEAGTKVCVAAGAKVLKLPYPGSAEACGAVTAAAGVVPWSVLSAGVDHATFLGQVEIAMQNGAAGVIAGRALWKDCVSLDRDVQRRLLRERAVPRLNEIKAVLARHIRAQPKN